MDGWNTSLSYWGGLFSGAKLFVSGRVTPINEVMTLLTTRRGPLCSPNSVRIFFQRKRSVTKFLAELQRPKFENPGHPRGPPLHCPPPRNLAIINGHLRDHGCLIPPKVGSFLGFKASGDPMPHCFAGSCWTTTRSCKCTGGGTVASSWVGRRLGIPPKCGDCNGNVPKIPLIHWEL